MQMTITDQLVHTTVRIECQQRSGEGSSGTGFFVNFCRRADGMHIPAVVTNKHVIRDATIGLFHLTLRDSDGGPIFGQHVPVPIHDFERMWILHPDENVDLAAGTLGPIVQWLEKQGKSVFYLPFDTDLIAKEAFNKELGAIEDILMIGYPNGLWDSKNNLPIVRRGVTATPPYIDFEGRPEFVIDCACFPGSSGSPIILLNQNGYHTKDGTMHLGASRLKLLGILWGGPQYTAQGEIKIVPVPTATQPIALSRIPNNLGYCVKAEQLMWFEEHFKKQMPAQVTQEVATT